jgi:ribonucleotide monophosphatase NagD (HAD superfamily)
VACGINAGIDSIFVLSGEGTEADIAQYGIHPTWIFSDIAALYRQLEETL